MKQNNEEWVNEILGKLDFIDKKVTQLVKQRNRLMMIVGLLAGWIAGKLVWALIF